MAMDKDNAYMKRVVFIPVTSLNQGVHLGVRAIFMPVGIVRS